MEIFSCPGYRIITITTITCCENIPAIRQLSPSVIYLQTEHCYFHMRKEERLEAQVEFSISDLSLEIRGLNTSEVGGGRITTGSHPDQTAALVHFVHFHVDAIYTELPDIKLP